MRTLRCLSLGLGLGLGLLVVLAAGPARATSHPGLVFGGDVCVTLFGMCIGSYDISPTGPAPAAMVAFSSLQDGFGNSGGTNPFAAPQNVPLAPPPLDLSQSFSTPSVGSADVSILLTSSLTTVGANEYLTMSSVGSITLSQTDLDLNSPNDPALFRLILFAPFMFRGAPGTLSMDLDFDLSSPTLTQFGPADSFTVTSCVSQGPMVILDYAWATNCNSGSGGTLVSLGDGDPLPTIDPVAAFSESISVKDTQYSAIFVLDFFVKNDFGPTTLSLDNFTLTMGAVPEPGTALLLAVGLLGLCAARRREART